MSKRTIGHHSNNTTFRKSMLENAWYAYPSWLNLNRDYNKINHIHITRLLGHPIGRIAGDDYALWGTCWRDLIIHNVSLLNSSNFQGHPGPSLRIVVCSGSGHCRTETSRKQLWWHQFNQLYSESLIYDILIRFILINEVIKDLLTYAYYVAKWKLSC